MLETLFSNIIFPDEESTTSGEMYSSSHRLIPGTRGHQHENSDYGRAGSANPSSLGHESGFQSSASLRSLTPSLLAGSLYEQPINDNVGGNVSIHLFISKLKLAQESRTILAAWPPSHQG